MRHEGRLTEWNDAKGFGFIAPVTGGPRVFVHVSEFPRGRRPAVDRGRGKYHRIWIGL